MLPDLIPTISKRLEIPLVDGNKHLDVFWIQLHYFEELDEVWEETNSSQDKHRVYDALNKNIEVIGKDMLALQNRWRSSIYAVLDDVKGRLDKGIV